MKKLRKESPPRWVVGVHACKEALVHRSSWVKEVVLQEGQQSFFNELVKEKGFSLKKRAKSFFDSLAQGHQGVAVSLVERPRFQDSTADQQKSLVTFLDGITDPHNLGAILRTAWLLKVDGVFIPKNRRVDLTPVVCKVASGGAEHIPVESCSFPSRLQWFKKKGYWVYGLSEKVPTSVVHRQMAPKAVLVVGSEQRGLRSSTQTFCDQLLSLPKRESSSSYNASVAFALGVYECLRTELS